MHRHHNHHQGPIHWGGVKARHDQAASSPKPRSTPLRLSFLAHDGAMHAGVPCAQSPGFKLSVPLTSVVTVSLSRNHICNCLHIVLEGISVQCNLNVGWEIQVSGVSVIAETLPRLPGISYSLLVFHWEIYDHQTFIKAGRPSARVVMLCWSERRAHGML
jgi:hypothetical protein